MPLQAQLGPLQTVAGQCGVTGAPLPEPSPATSNLLSSFTDGIAVDPLGNLYIADYSNHRIRRVDTAGTIITYAGNGVAGFADGPSTSAQFRNPAAVAVDPATLDVYVADYGNHRIRKIDAGGNVSTVVGNGAASSAGDGGQGTNATINGPVRLDLDRPRNVLYIADFSGQRVRALNLSTGIISTVAGTGTSGINGINGPAAQAQLSSPAGVAVDPFGTLYIAEVSGTCRLTKIEGGNLVLAAGNGSCASSGDGGPPSNAAFQAHDIAFDPNGNLYIAERTNNRVRRIDFAANRIDTVAGNGGSGCSGDGEPPEAIALGSPEGLAISPDNRIFISQTIGVVRSTAGIAQPASMVIVSGSPQVTHVGTDFPESLVVAVHDIHGNPVPGITVNFDGGGLLIHPQVAVTDFNGFAKVIVMAPPFIGTFPVRAFAGPLVAEGIFTVIAGPPAFLSFVVNPSDTRAGDPIAPFTLLLTDSFNNPIPGVPIHLNRIPGGPLQGPVVMTTDPSGKANFSDISITMAGIYQLDAQSVGGPAAISNPFQILNGAGTHIKPLSGSGQTTGAGTAFPAPLQAEVIDSFGNPVAGASVVFSVPSTASSGTFGGGPSVTITTDAAGIATSPLLTANTQPGTFQVTASLTGTPPATFTLTIVPGNANHLKFIQQPTDATAGTPIAPAVTVQLVDSFGNPIHSPGVPIALQETLLSVSRAVTPPVFTPQPTDANGIATFTALSFNQPGQYELTATADGIDSAISSPFTIRVGAPAVIAASGGAAQSAEILTPFQQPLLISVRDSLGNPVSGATVTFAPPGSGASATLSATSATTDSTGHASVTATANATAGSYMVNATVGSLSPVSFSLTNTTGAPGQVTFPQGPSNTVAGEPVTPAVVVQVVDGGGNPIPNVPVTLSIQGGGATLNGTLTATTDANGHATFGDLSINTTGTYQLIATEGTISGVSSPFQISASQSNVEILAYMGGDQEAIAGTAYSGPLQVLVTDPFGNRISGAQVTFTAPSSGPTVAFSGSATATTDANGIAISPSITANSEAGPFQVTATTDGASTPAVFNLTNLAASPTSTHLTFVQHPSDTPAGQTITPSVTVQLLDISGNPVATAGVPVVLESNTLLQRRRSFAGTVTQTTDANGVATFTNLNVIQPGTFQLEANSDGHASATSLPFNVTAGTPTNIIPTGGSAQSAFVLTTFGAPLQVTVTDAANNPVAGVVVVFTAPSTGASGTIGGQVTFTATTDAQGRATATVTANNIAGSYTVIASTTAVAGSATFSLTNLPPAAGSLAFGQQPSNTQAGQVITPPVTVQLHNNSGQPINESGVAVTISLSSGSGTLLGTLVQVTDATGIATFNDLRIAETGTKQLHASSSAEAPATSNSFQITAAGAATITAHSGTPQTTILPQPFQVPLQAQVLDASGNPVSGANVTFSLPASGPSGTFAASATVATNNNGIATAPTLTPNSSVGSFTVTASVSGVPNPATFSLTNLPLPGDLTVDNTQLSFISEFNQPARAGQQVQVASSSGTPIVWSASSSAPWLQVNPASGTSPTAVTISVNPSGLVPGTYTGSVLFASTTGGDAAVLVTFTITSKPTLVVTPPALVFNTANNTTVPAPEFLQTSSTPGNIAYKVVAQVNTPNGGTWLSVASAQGQTPGSTQVSVNATGLAQGIYGGVIVFTPNDSTISPVTVPVTLVVGCGSGGCSGPTPPAANGPVILAVTNAASFHPNGAPAAIMTIFGLNLSDAIHQATTYPLPTQLGPTRVTVNGTLVPLFYVSPTQINFQMPSDIPTGTPQIVVNTGLLRAVSSGFPAALSPVDPGLFVTPDHRAAALNQDLSIHTAATPQPAGAVILLYMTGTGPLNPPLADGTAAPDAPLSLINGPTQVTIGGQPAQVVYAGEAPGFAGLEQINAVIPSGLAPGDQPVFININGVSSNAGLITVK